MGGGAVNEDGRAFIVHAIILYRINFLSCTCITFKKKIVGCLKFEILTTFFMLHWGDSVQTYLTLF